MEQMLRLLHNCGLPAEDVDFINSDGKAMNKLLLEVGCLVPSFWHAEDSVKQYCSRNITASLYGFTS